PARTNRDLGILEERFALSEERRVKQRIAQFDLFGRQSAFEAVLTSQLATFQDRRAVGRFGGNLGAIKIAGQIERVGQLPRSRFEGYGSGEGKKVAIERILGWFRK